MMYGACDRVVALYDKSDDIESDDIESGRMVILYIPRGRWYRCTSSVGAVWEQFERRGLDLESAIEAAAGDRVRAEKLRGNVMKELPKLRRRRLVTRRRRAPHRLYSRLLPAGPPPRRRVTPTEHDYLALRWRVARWRAVRWRAAAIVGFATALVLRALPLGLTLRIMWVVSRLRRRHATLQSARQLVAAVNDVAWWYPGRARCLEVSWGAWVAGILLGEVPTWCLGTQFDPLRRHAWLVAEGTAVDHERQETTYRAMLQISPSRGGSPTPV